MPEQKTLERARKAKREGKAPTTQAGEFVREEIEHVRKGKHGARSTKQAIAIGLSKARRSGVKLKPPKRGQASASTRKTAQRAYRAGQSGAKRKPSQGSFETGAIGGCAAAADLGLTRKALMMVTPIPPPRPDPHPAPSPAPVPDPHPLPPPPQPIPEPPMPTAQV